VTVQSSGVFVPHMNKHTDLPLWQLIKSTINYQAGLPCYLPILILWSSLWFFP